MASKQSHTGKLHEPAPRACVHCPWRRSNQGKRHPHGWYSKKNLSALWSQLRRGELMSCHPTDPGNVVPENCANRPAPLDAETRECAGVLVLVEREMFTFNRMVGEAAKDVGVALKRYRKERPSGLTRTGILENAMRIAYGGVPLLGKCALPALDLDDADVHYPPLGEWKK